MVEILSMKNNSLNMHTNPEKMNMTDETRIDSVPLPYPSFTMRWTGREAGRDRYWPTQVAAGEFPIEFPVYTADQLRAYGDERAWAVVNYASVDLDRACSRITELESMLKMIATRAYSFPFFPMGWHLPEAFRVAGMEMPKRPDTDDTHDALSARVAELEDKLAEANSLIRYLFAEYTNLYSIPDNRPSFIHHHPNWRKLYRRAVEIGAIAAGGGRGWQLTPNC